MDRRFTDLIDPFNRQLVSQVRPEGWQNPSPAGRYNLVVIGAGTAGLVSAAAAAGLGARVALIEENLMGGDCLNVGCVPSKALLAAARAVFARGGRESLGVAAAEEPPVDFPQIMERLRRERAAIAANDSAERFRGLGVDVFYGSARFTGRDRLEVGGAELRFARAIVATGARPALPPIDGLEEAGFLTNESLFELKMLPARLTIVGAGPIGCEMAQAFARLGSAVTIIDRDDSILSHDDADAAARVRTSLERDGVRFLLGSTIVRVDADKSCVVRHQDETHRIPSDAILVAVGRSANLEGLDLEAAGVDVDGGRLVVDDRLQTSNSKIYAAGDVASRYQFTHAADAMARIAIRNALFWGRSKASALEIPWVTYTAPELAHIGHTPASAAKAGVAIDTYEVEMAEVDRARLEGEGEGFLRVHTARGSDTILGATWVSAHAGESISLVGLAMRESIGLGAIAKTVFPYPTQSEALRRLSDQYSRTRLTPRREALLRWVFRWRRR